MNEIKIFENSRFGNLRTIMQDGNPWFVAADVCKALDISNPTMALQRLDGDEKMTLNSTDTHSKKRGGAQSFNIVSESGLYALILGSRKKEARQFKRWITHDVLPAIRQHGVYATPAAISSMLADPDALISILNQLKSERAARLEAESNEQSALANLKAAQDKLADTFPSVVYASADDAIRENCCSIADLAHSLSVDSHRSVTRNQLFSWLRSNGYIQQESCLPTPKGLKSGFFLIMEKSSGTSHYYTTAVTLAGQLHFTAVFS